MRKTFVFGTGKMGAEYKKVLEALKQDITFVGRPGSKSSLDSAYKNENILRTDDYKSLGLEGNNVIICVSNHNLLLVVNKVLQQNPAQILVEKPVAFSIKEIEHLILTSKRHCVPVFVAMNRRFYISVNKAKQLLSVDGGATSVHFEFSEQLDYQDFNKFSKATLKNWFLSNPIHVLDTVRYLLGDIDKIAHLVRSAPISWHPSGSIYCGSGITNMNVPYSFHANWSSAGSWGIDLYTCKRKISLKPMEKVLIVDQGEFIGKFLEIEDTIDTDYKPGVFNLVSAFVTNNKKDLVDLSEYQKSFLLANQISGYCEF